MTYRMQEVKVGLVVVASVLLLAVFVVIISGVRLHRETVYYTTRLDWVGGLDVGTPVRLGGVRVGRIAQVAFPKGDDRRIQLLLEVQKGTPIKTDSRAYLTSIGLMGEFYVEIEPGSPEAPLLAPGSEIPSLPSTTFSQLSQRMGELSGDLRALLTHVNHLLDAQNPEGLAALVRNVNELVVANSSQVARLAASLDSSLREIRSLTGSMQQALNENRAALARSVVDLDSLLARTADLVVSLKRATRTVDATLVENSEQITAILAGLERATRNLEAFSAEIRQKPWSLVRKSYPKPRELPR